MRLTALGIKRGDAYLLQNDNNENFLFDAGSPSVFQLLHQKGCCHLRVAICSHNDADHTDGFENLLKSCIRIDELWLPNIWASIVLFLNNHSENINEDYISSLKKEIGKINVDIQAIYNQRDISPLEIEQVQYKEVYQKLPYKTDKILKIIKLARRKNIRIRFFKPLDYEVNNVCDFGFVAKNSEEVNSVPVLNSITQLAMAIKLSAENKYSLVFEYRQDEPRILFTADSDLYFVQQNGIHYNGSMVITAPHHGSDSNASAYDKIQADNPFYIRTFYNKKHSIKAFLALQNCQKYCVRCCHQEQEVVFEWNNDSWYNVSGHSCISYY